MNKSVGLLKLESESAVKFRGHALNKWSHSFNIKGNQIKADAHCKYCGMAVFVNSRPLPNEIDISGEAVALNCPES